MIEGSKLYDIPLANYIHIVKPCPFCGSKNFIYARTYIEWRTPTNAEKNLEEILRTNRIGCNFCNIDMCSDDLSFEELICKWNDRIGDN